MTQAEAQPLHEHADAHRDSRVVAAARAFAENVLPGKIVRIAEFGLPSVGLDDCATHFVAIEGDETSILACVTIAPNGSVSVDYLTAS